MCFKIFNNKWIDPSIQNWIHIYIYDLPCVNNCGTQHQITNLINITKTNMRWFYIFHIKQNEEFQGHKYYIVKINIVPCSGEPWPRLEIEIIVFLLICSAVNH